MGVYGHYKWLYNQGLKTTRSAKTAARTAPQYDGLFDDDQWQNWYLKPGPANKCEIDFWLSQ